MTVMYHTSHVVAYKDPKMEGFTAKYLILLRKFRAINKSLFGRGDKFCHFYGDNHNINLISLRKLTMETEKWMESDGYVFVYFGQQLSKASKRCVNKLIVSECIELCALLGFGNYTNVLW